ncbi:uncharacterized protein LOC131649304 [Vicia villosa]|uniref:uncharacterized protein LOC131649304 n=1 Tax=Vicia villosa TaxID=3911 RepID=UPI00273C7DAF|nr:uncharacterized protein LOC131649304 [Vicia villosa]
MAPHTATNGTPSTSNNQPILPVLTGPSMARKKRRIILSNKRSASNMSNKENLNDTNPPVLIPTQTPTSRQRLPLTANLSNLINTAPSHRHVCQTSSNNKKSRLRFNPGHNLLASFNQTVRPFRNTDEPSTSNAPITSHTASRTLPTAPTAAYLSDDSDSNSEDENLCHSSDGDDEVDNEPLVDSHLEEYSDIGDRVWECHSCHAVMWYQERKANTRHSTVPRFSRCCRSGKVVLPLLNDPPQLLQNLLYNGTSSESRNYQANIRTYNAMFSFTSPGMKFDTTLADGGGPPTLRLHGQTCHRIGTLIPEDGDSPQFAQLYIFDTDNEVENRVKCFSDNDNIDRDIVSKLKIMLDDCNPHAKAFRMARDLLKANAFLDLKLRLISDRPGDGRVYNTPTVSEVAALIVGDIDPSTPRDIIIHARNEHLQQITEFHPAYLAYQYPLIFLYGEDGYRKNILHRYEHEREVTRKNRQSIKDWLSFRLQERPMEATTLLHSRRLFQQFLVDGFAMMESERLNWLRTNQSKLRVGKYNQLQAEVNGNQTNTPSKRGKRVVLPSTFVGSKRYMDQLYFDGMAISSKLGFPDLFVTFTCNPAWPEIARALANTTLKPHDRPDLISKVFKIKFDELMTDITKRHVLGKVIAFMYTIEFQKRGLPHAHILVFLHPQSKYPTPSDIDKIICAEIPDPALHPRLYNLVSAHMMHGPCGRSRLRSPCMKNGKCSKYFPKNYQEATVVDADGYPLYRRRSNSHVILKNGISMDNRHVVPYNTRLILKYQAHINMEWCNQITSIKYLFKYIHKGFDRITATITASNSSSGSNKEPVDEIKQYLDCRYMSPSEACWRIYSYKIHGRRPAVERMFYHLVGEKAVYYADHDRMENILEKASVTESMFTAWLVANGKYEEARELTYGQFVSKFVYDKRSRTWKPRKKGFTIGRLIWVPPTTGELFYLRMMLTVVKGPSTYDEIHKVGGTQFDTFRDACFAMGFLEDDREYIGAIKEASEWGSGHFLRKLFVIILLSGNVNRPAHVWNESWILLSDGLLHDQRLLAHNKDLVLADEQLMNLTLIEIEKLLQANRRTLHDFKPIPYPDGYVLQQLGNRLIYDERNYDVDAMRTEFTQLFNAFTAEQKTIFDKIMASVHSQKGGVFFLHGYGGTGKTYMWRTLASALRSKHDICLTVATSGIASLLLPGGRTAHSKFKIPVPTMENSTCKILYNDEVAELLRQTKLIIWDEAPMAHKHAFEALDRTLKDVMSTYSNSKDVFGGKVVVFGGDFRQILPVVPRGSRSDIVHSAINASYIWRSVQVLTLTQNMRLQSGPNEHEKKEIADFSKWLLQIGEGKLSEPNDGFADIELPPELLITDYDDPIVAIVNSTYPDFILHYQSNDYLKSRAILASTLEVVDQINDHVLDLMPGEIKDYYSSNSVDKSEIHDTNVVDILTPEFLSSLSTSGLPNHHIKLKVGTPVMLMRNIDQSEGLCNGTRVMITKMANHVLEAKVMAGKGVGNTVYIPRMDMSPSQSPWPFKLSRRQFPVVVSYAMTINKSQGQSLDTVGLYLPRDVFTHGQIYVAISRVTTKKGIKILVYDENDKGKSTTANVVYKEVFHNI